jgi:hypothetical protein
MSESTGFCCNMNAMTRNERDRYEALRAKLEAAVVSVEELPDGYSLCLRAEAVAADELVEWIAFEQKCCPFFALKTTGQPNAPTLQITGRAGVKDFIRAEFSAIRFE